MNLKHGITLFLWVLFAPWSYSQLLITEVYYNTPSNEKLYFASGFNPVTANKHHRGEFVEIYNYSDRDINLKNWYIKDYLGIFWLPDKIIKKNQFMVIAYSSLPYHQTPFTELFSTTQGKEDQIILQNKILLRNKAEEITLGFAVDNQIFLIERDRYQWFTYDEPQSNFVHDIWQNPSNYYSVNSLQYKPNTISAYYAAPNPLEATFVPATQSYSEIVKDDFLKYYSFLKWDDIEHLLDMSCISLIDKISQTPQGAYASNGKCFMFDDSGNLIAGVNCDGAIDPPTSPITEYNTDELESIKDHIVIYPNPTKSSFNYDVTITWSGPALNKINNLKVFSSIGGIVFDFSPVQGINSTNFHLQNQLPGTFVVNFVLNTGQVISKIILRW